MTTTIKATQRDFVKELIASGAYPNEDAVIYTALKKLKEEHEQKKSILFAELDKGLKDIEEGRYEEYTPDMVRNITQQIIERRSQE